MNIKDYLSENILYFDGGMGTLLQERGIPPGELPERWNITHPEIIKEIHKSYFDAGSNVVNTNTFGANSLKFSDQELEKIIEGGVNLARQAQKESKSTSPKWVALDIGPTGKMLKPYGDLDFEDAVSIFAKTVKLGVKCGADLIFIETMNDSYETKAALLAARENSDLPVFVSNAYGEDGKLMTGASPAAMVALLEGMGADAIGVNCSLGPKALSDVVLEYLKYSSLPVILKPNAGLPKVEDGKTVFDILPADFAEEVSSLAKLGARVLGGCCGTTPEYIKETVKKTKSIDLIPIEKKSYTVVSSYNNTVLFGDTPVLIGERINPTGKKRVKEALLSGDPDYILREALTQEEKGVQILDVNVGLPGIDEKSMLTRVISELQAITSLPLQIDSSDPSAMEAALRRYNGKAMINSVNGKSESMSQVFPLVKKYGGLVVALTLDENGIPKNAEDRLLIAKKILIEAKKYGIDKKDIIFDPLAMTVSADNSAAKETMRAVELITNELGCHTSLGVSNVSFGLPERDLITSSFFALTLAKGLSAAIMNPYSTEMMKVYYTYLALIGKDENCQRYIEFAENIPKTEVKAVEKTKNELVGSELQKAIIKGLKDKAASITKELLNNKTEALDIVNSEIIPALNTVGDGFEKKTLYLPSLLMSAEAAKASFDVIKDCSLSSSENKGETFVIATVKGDIHDIGKNIVKLILENYGYNVVDLGKDVAPSVIVDEVIRLHAPLVGLSALMTTTVPSMEETIKLLREKAPFAHIIVGGAVLNKEYARSIGADGYAGDAMETVKLAKELV